MHMLLSTDDFGLLPIDYGSIKHISPMLDWTRDMVAKMLGELVDAKLILPYEVNGKHFAAMAKSKNYIRSMRPKYPIPPFGLINIIGILGYKSQIVKESVEKLLNEINGNGSARGTLGAPQGLPREGKEVRKLGTIKEKHTPLPPLKGGGVPLFLKLPDWLDSEVWENFVAFRKEKKSALSDHAKKLAFTKLAELREAGHDPVAVIEQSILNGWKGLFEVAERKTQGNGQWWASDAGVDAKGRELGLKARGGENYSSYKARIFEKIKEEK